ncbi:glycoside hydrolase family 5 protein [Phenylobacterium conjunctum]|uniref:Glycoside hydrolase family 5 protein n=1 Tax=Phenylobacterium conjunctum TaxID=1298959 RepID=A0ABW3T6K0_9CAUL
MAPNEILRLRQVGFDFVRLAVAPDLFLRTVGSKRDDAIAELRKIIGRFVAADLKVVLDLHPNERIPGYRGKDYIGGVNQPVVMEYFQTVGDMARLLSSFPPGVVALELLNEPAAYPPRSGVWDAIQIQAHTEVRRVSSLIPIIVTGSMGGGVEGLLNLDPGPYRGSNALFSFHYYDPMIFTHQATSAGRRYFTNVTWPPRRNDFAKAVEGTTSAVLRDGNIGAVDARRAVVRTTSELRQYYFTQEGEETIRSDFGRVESWANKHGLALDRIFLGEFGVNRSVGAGAGAPAPDAERWLRSVRLAAEQRSFAWALWCYSGPVRMTLTNEWPAETMDPGVLRSLGMRVPSLNAKN